MDVQDGDHSWNEEMITRADDLYEFLSLFDDYYTIPRDYDQSGRLMNMVEAHVLQVIADGGHTNVTQLSQRFRRTKGAISQIVSKLEARGFVIKVPDENNANVIWIEASEEGKKMNDAHYEYDKRALLRTDKFLKRYCTQEEIDHFYSVVRAYNIIMEKGNAIRKQKNKSRNKI